MKIELVNNLIILSGDTYQYIDKIRLFPERKAIRKNKRFVAWSFPYQIDTVIELNARLNLNITLPQTKIKEVGKINYKLSLYEHQKQSVKKALSLNYFADLSEPGSGKTRTQIELILQRQVYPILIVCPKSIIEAVWIEQLLENAPEIDAIPLIGGSAKIKNTLKYLDFGNTACIINYESAALVLPELKKVDWKFIILDEVTKIKSPKSKRSKAIMKLRESAKYRSIMTGTVSPNGAIDIFNQFKFLDMSIFGDSYYSFRQRYFEQGGFQGKEYTIKPGSLEMIRDKMKQCSIQHHKRDCVDLPPLVHEKRAIEMHPEQAKLYKQMKDELLIEIENAVITAPFIITKLMKLRQIASGFVYLDPDIFELKNNKIKEMLSIIEQIDGKIIIFAHFKQSIAVIHRALTKKNISCLAFNHKLQEFKRQETIDRFKSDNIKVLIANPLSAGHGLNLQFCSDIIYYEHDFSLEAYEQSVQRIERIGQKNKMTVYHLITKKTLESYILNKLNKKIDINKHLDISELKESLQ